MDLVYHIQFRQNPFSRQEAKVARTLLDNPGFAAIATIEQLAARAGVSTEIVGHFAKSLGCQDLNDFIGLMRAQPAAQAADGTAVPQPVLGGMDVAFATAADIGKLPGVNPDTLSRFARSIGCEDIADIVYQIRARQNQLSQQEAKVAQTILDDIAFASSATIEQLAAQAAVSPATITRFAKTLGCDDIRDLRMKLAQASVAGSRYLNGAPPADDSGPRLWRQRLGDVESTLHQQMQSLDHAALIAVCQRLSQSKSVHIFGVGSMTLYVNDLQQRLVGMGCPAFACLDPALMRMTASTLGALQSVILLSGGGENGDLLNAARLTAATGAYSVALAPAGSTLAGLTDSLLPIGTGSAARYGLMLTLDLLLAQLLPESLNAQAAD
ncbi:MurR/RpiR family transcriptional regulator [Serratia ficaria]|uniref:Als operon repressor n=1 Tax=Serratia ficaria TaxID=61651 RepID=A0A240BUQ8_SERFI|nr:MurR/RpiR family transcriptional regulator [Serratia ficaria]REF45325.1 RpiR family transcriptional regulator [Serratia ficaria]CAI0882591.1 Als operon repressor [Serratia ficaria]CAI0898360.1 Als operon repressor [Serratia ficaria]CAI0934769.1 Als operon repressor [Serratia ficaria]CAI2013397.1 Als operon repressor [Serratia ficaria]